jgi:XisH protein
VASNSSGEERGRFDARARPVSPSDGQFTIYFEVLSRIEPDRELYLAVSEEVYINVFDEPIGKLLADSQRILLIVFDPQSETIRQWTPRNPTTC